MLPVSEPSDRPTIAVRMRAGYVFAAALRSVLALGLLVALPIAGAIGCSDEATPIPAVPSESAGGSGMPGGSGQPIPDAPQADLPEIVDGNVEYAGYRWPVPEGWAITGSNQFVDLVISLPAPEGVEAGPARMSLGRTIGGVEPNQDRWRGQVSDPRDEARTEEALADGATAYRFDIRGTIASMGSSAPTGDGQRMIAWLVAGRADAETLLSIRVVGPSATVDAWADDFDRFVRTSSRLPEEDPE